MSYHASLLQLPNVIIDPSKVQETTPKALHFRNNLLPEVLYKLAVKEPTWNFVIDGYTMPSAFNVSDITVSCSGEQLGKLFLDYYRSEYRVVIESHRVKTSRGRQRTADAARALALCKKMFVPRSLHERVDKSLSDAADELRQVEATFASNIYQAARALNSDALTFVLSKYRQEFYDHMVITNPKNSGCIAKYEEATQHRTTVEKVYEEFSAGNTALVILDSGKYIVRRKDNVELFDADTLPENLRGKLGILKLVEEGQVVSDTGCRVNAEVFVIVIDEPTA